MTVRLVVACGGGIFTTTVVTDRIKEILWKEKIRYTITPAKITEIANISDVDLIVVTGKTNTKNVNNIPVMIGMPLFTGVGAEEFTAHFLKEVRRIEEEKKSADP